MELDNETVEAIAAEGAPLVAGLDGMQVRALAPIFAKHLPDPRPTEAEDHAQRTSGGSER
jgi:hypothetical protein